MTKRFFDETLDKVIYVWPWDAAPDVLKALSDHGGDEDGIAFIPNTASIPYWLERLWACYGDPQEIKIADGTIYIWAHA